jgi:signal transduction histidine kinase
MLSAASLFEEAQNQVDHNRLIALINSLNDGFLALTQAGKIELSNGVALDLLDTNSLHEKQIEQAMPLLAPDDQMVNPLALLGEKPNYTSRDYRLRYADGKDISLWLSISAVRPSFSGGKPGYVILFRDISDEKRHQDERDEFISVASHELRNPVAIAEGSLSNALLLSGKENISQPLKQVLQAAHQQMVFLGNLINDLAMVSRAEQGIAEQNSEQFDAADVLKSLVSDYQASAAKKNLTISLQIDGPVPVFSNKLYVREILQNFITNAIKYTPQGTITLSGAADASGVHLAVADEGIGISQPEQQKIFSKFFRSQDSRVRNISGTGLGLYVSNKLAKSLGGSISFSSEPEKGSHFILNLPAPKTAAEPVAQTAGMV